MEICKRSSQEAASQVINSSILCKSGSKVQWRATRGSSANSTNNTPRVQKFAKVMCGSCLHLHADDELGNSVWEWIQRSTERSQRFDQRNAGVQNFACKGRAGKLPTPAPASAMTVEPRNPARTLTTSRSCSVTVLRSKRWTLAAPASTCAGSTVVSRGRRVSDSRATSRIAVMFTPY